MRGILTLSAILIGFNNCIIAQTPVQQGYATLNWSDEFNTPNISINNWLLVNNCDHVEGNQLYKASFEVIDLNGKVQKTLDAGINGYNSNSFQMELFGFKPGIYSVKMLVDGISTDTKKIFIQ